MHNKNNLGGDLFTKGTCKGYDKKINNTICGLIGLKSTNKPLPEYIQ